MSAQDLIELPRKRPFLPFRIYATDGKSYNVRHPDRALVLKTRVILPLADDADDLPKRSEHLALIHLVGTEELSSGVSPASATSE